jgi:DNA-binding transcriptional MerR regulator/methylmalonyl-CoA mutase cobalamin-binding subunit
MDASVPGSSAHYPIKVAARLTGVGIDTLRAWERRHHAIRPTRDARGRMYTDADLERIRLLRDAVLNGHPIGRIAALDAPALRGLGASTRHADRTPEAEDEPSGVRGIMDALAAFDLAALETLLRRAATLSRPPALLRDVIVPGLRAAGDEWHARRLGTAHEHLLSALVRDVLGSLMRLHVRTEVADRLIFATPAGERHEFGALGAAVLAASGGLGAVYLGPDVPAADLVDIAATIDADVVALGVTGAEPALPALAREIEIVARSLSRDVELWIGGAAATELAAVHPRVLAIADYDALEKELHRLGGRY